MAHGVRLQNEGIFVSLRFSGVPTVWKYIIVLANFSATALTSGTFCASFVWYIRDLEILYSIAMHTFFLFSVPGFRDDLFEVTVEMSVLRHSFAVQLCCGCFVMLCYATAMLWLWSALEVNSLRSVTYAVVIMQAQKSSERGQFNHITILLFLFWFCYAFSFISFPRFRYHH